MIIIHNSNNNFQSFIELRLHLLQSLFERLIAGYYRSLITIELPHPIVSDHKSEPFQNVQMVLELDCLTDIIKLVRVQFVNYYHWRHLLYL